MVFEDLSNGLLTWEQSDLLIGPLAHLVEELSPEDDAFCILPAASEVSSIQQTHTTALWAQAVEFPRFVELFNGAAINVSEERLADGHGCSW